MSRPRSLVRHVTLAAILAAVPAVASAQFVPDPKNDFIPSYTGPHAPDLDVRSAAFTMDASGFHFQSFQGADIDPASGHLFVWGVNRGQGTARFGAIATGVLFDAVLAINPGAPTNSVRDLLANTSFTLPVGAVSFHDNYLRIDVPFAALPSTGFTFDQYTANLWPRSGAGGNNVIADFAPDNSNILVSQTPEPATLLLVAPALAGIVVVRRRRQAAR